jgi:phosphoesterase RecJ-like protein
MSYGFDVARINYLMFEMKTRRRIELEQKAYAGIEYFFGGRCAAIALSIEMLEGVDSADTNNISILPKQVEGVEAGIIFKERKPKIGEINSEPTWKISVRTNRNINAQEICAALGGGGHMCAAGCKLEGSLEKVKGIVLAEIGKQMSPDEC